VDKSCCGEQKLEPGNKTQCGSKKKLRNKTTFSDAIDVVDTIEAERLLSTMRREQPTGE